MKRLVRNLFLYLKNFFKNPNKTQEKKTILSKNSPYLNENIKWSTPIPEEYFSIPSQVYLQEDWGLYPKFGHHTGVDYGGQGKKDIPVFACSDGEIIYQETSDSPLGQFLGNHLAIYIPSVDKSFLYCHLKNKPRELGKITAGEQVGIMGNTGKSAGKAIHLHLEGFHGYFKKEWRSFKSLEDIKTKTFDADSFIRTKIKKPEI